MTPLAMRRLTILREEPVKFTELYLDVYVEGDSMEQKAFAEMFIKARCSKAISPDVADLVVFTGGADVNPELYGEKPHKTVRYDDKRDMRDMELYYHCINNRIPMFGVCRGAQFLHVMNGGKLIQDLDNHYGDHPIYDVLDRRIIKSVSSVHHQAVLEPGDDNDDFLRIADAFRSTTRHLNPETTTKGRHLDVEAFFYRSTACLGIQGHPEYRGYDEFLQWTFGVLDDMFTTNPDIVVENKFRRLRDKTRSTISKDVVVEENV